MTKKTKLTKKQIANLKRAGRRLADRAPVIGFPEYQKRLLKLIAKGYDLKWSDGH